MNLEYLLLGIFVGIVLTCAFAKLVLFNGVIKIDKSDPEKDIYRLCVLRIERLDNRKYILLKVDKNADLTRE